MTLAILLLGVAHAPFVRARVLARAVARADADLGIHLAGARFTYGLFSLTAELHAVELRANGAEAAFFTADAVRVDLPWSILGATMDLQSLEIDQPRLNVVRDLQGTFNLPGFAAIAQGPSQPLGPIHIDHLVVRDLDWHYADAPVQVSADGRGVTPALGRPAGGRLHGRLSMSQRATMRVNDGRTTIDEISGRLGFDGRAIAVDELTVRAPGPMFESRGCSTCCGRSHTPTCDTRAARIWPDSPRGCDSPVGQADAWSSLGASRAHSID